MGVLYEVFRADDHMLGAIALDQGPEGAGLPAVPAVGVIELAMLEALLAGEDAGLDVPAPLAESDEAWLYRVTARLASLLREAGPAEVAAAVGRWVETDELLGWSEPEGLAVVEALAELAREADEAGQRLFLWVSL